MPRNRSEKEPKWMRPLSEAVRKSCILEEAYLAERTDEQLTATNNHWASMSQRDKNICHQMSREHQMEIANHATKSK